MGGFPHLRVPPEAVQLPPDELERLPASAVRVYRAVLENGPLAHADLQQITGMSPRTIRFAVRRLKDEKILDSRMSLRDCRTCYFFIHARLVDPSYIEQERAAGHDDSDVAISVRQERRF